MHEKFNGADVKPLGHGVYYSDLQNTDGIQVGILVWHEDCPIHGGRPYEADCVGTVLFDIPENAVGTMAGRPKWHVAREEPLTLTPSILRKECQLHGWITDGKWVPA
jgi:hypothetical protein